MRGPGTEGGEALQRGWAGADLAPSRFSHRDAWTTALTGIRSRATRSLLSSLGIAVSIAALTAITGLAASNQAGVLADLDTQGANLVVVTPAGGADAPAAFLPDSSPAMVGRMPGVQSAAVMHAVPAGVHAYKNDLVPVGESNGLGVVGVDPGYFRAIGAEFFRGEPFDEAGRSLPEAVLGHEAARLLGVAKVGQRIWVASEWYLVTGILEPRPRVTGLDNSVLLGDAWVQQRLWAGRSDVAAPVTTDAHISSLTLRVTAADLDVVRRSLAATVHAGRPAEVSVSNPSPLVATRAAVDGSLSGLVSALAAVALLVGGIGIANTMVVAVLERCGEIGLRRALGARAGHVARQFLLEGLLLAGGGGLGGWVVGALVVGAAAVVGGQPFVLPAFTAALYPAVAMLVGLIAGLHPALRAAGVPPTSALRAG